MIEYEDDEGALPDESHNDIPHAIASALRSTMATFVREIDPSIDIATQLFAAEMNASFFRRVAFDAGIPKEAVNDMRAGASKCAKFDYERFLERAKANNAISPTMKRPSLPA
jgi:hypothetical protein